jgi:hypothetical protein
MTPCKLFKGAESQYLKLLNTYRENKYKVSNIQELSEEHESLVEHNLILHGFSRSFNRKKDRILRNIKTVLKDPS